MESLSSSMHTKCKSKIFMESDRQAKKLISYSRNFVLFFLRENQRGDESVKVKGSLFGCTKVHKC
jgi:hypothetical protein